MKLLESLFPRLCRRPGDSDSKVLDLRRQLKEVREMRDSYKDRAHAAEQALKELQRRHAADPDRCRAALQQVLDQPLPEVLQGRREALRETSFRIDVEDDMIWSADTRNYFEVGLQALTLIAEGMLQVPPGRAPIRLLDLPCGHGRVMRWMRSCYPEAALYGCDVQEHGMAFCQREFGSVPVPPAAFPADLAVEAGFDLIWIGSLFTHLTKKEFDRFLRHLPRLLNPGGVVIFTTHGARAWSQLNSGDTFHLKTMDRAAMKTEHAATGFTYAPYERTPDYGVSFSTREYVNELVEKTGQLAVHEVREGLWGSLQDVFICRMKA